MANQIKFDVGFNINNADFTKLRSSLQDIQKLTAKSFSEINGSQIKDVNLELWEVKNTAKLVDEALVKAFNPKLNTINFQTFNRELKAIDLSIEEIYKNFAKAGIAGQIGFQRLATTALTTNKELTKTNTILDRMGTTLGNTIKWNIASGAVNKLSGSIQEAYGYVKALDGSLNDIQIVTGKSAESMEVFAKQANNAAKSLGTSTTNYTKSALTFYQQGLSDEEVKARAELSNKVSNVTGLSGDQAAEYVTAVLNGYKVGAEEAEHAMDKLAAVAAATASDLAELSEGMSKVASAGHAMGVTEDQLAATLSTVISVTRQSAATVGTAFKTIYARISDIEAGTEDAEVSLGAYTAKMKEMGFNVLDSSGHLRDLGEVMEEIGDSWNTLTREQQVSLTQTMAGTRQYNNLIALFDNWDDYMKSLNVSMKANGTLQEQQDIYLESTSAHLKQLSASAEDVFDSFLDPGTINGMADAMSKLLDLTSNWIDALGGGGDVLLTLGSIAGKVFSTQIAKSLGDTIKNIKQPQISQEQIEAEMRATGQLGNLPNKQVQELVAMKQQILEYSHLLTEEQQKEANAFIQRRSELLEEQAILEDNERVGLEFMQGLQRAREDMADAPELDFDVFTDQVEDFEAANENITKAMDTTVETINKERAAVDELAKAYDRSITTYEKAKKRKKKNKTRERPEDKLNRDLQSFLTDGGKEDIAVDRIGQMLGPDNANYQKLQSLLADLKASTTDSDKFKALLADYTKAYDKACSEIDQRSKKLVDALEAHSTGASKELKDNLENDKQTFIAWLEDPAIKQGIDNTTQLVSSLGQLAAAMNILSNIPDIWNDENLSTGEKTLQLVQNLVTALPLVVSSVVTLSKLSDAKFYKPVLNVFKGIGGLLVGHLPVILAITAAVGTLTFVIHKAVKAWNADAEAAKEAAQQVENLAKSYEELSSSVKTFKEEASNYTDAVKSLQDLDKTTDEYRQKLAETQKQAKELVETYKLFDQYDPSTGLLKDGVLDNLIKEADKKVLDAEAGVYGARIYANQARQQADVTKLSRQIQIQDRRPTADRAPARHQDVYAPTTYSSEMRNATDAEVINFADTLKKMGAITQQEIQDQLGVSDQLAEAIFKNKDALLDLANSMEEATKANDYYAHEILKIDIQKTHGQRIEEISTGKNGEVNAQLAEQVANAVTGYEIKLEKDQDKYISDQLANIDVSKITNNRALNNILADTMWEKTQVNNDEDIARLYAEKVANIPNVDDYIYDKGALRAADGKAVVENISIETMRKELARQAKIEKILADTVSPDSNQQEQMLKAVENLIKSGQAANNKYGADFVGAILDQVATGDLSKLDLSSIMGNLDEEEFNELKEADTDQLLAALHLDEKTIIQLGYESADAFVKAFQENFDQEWDEEAWNNHFAGAVKAAKTDTEALISGIQSGEIDSSNIAENEQYQDLLKQMDDIQDADKDLIAANQILKQTWLAGTQEYTEALEYVQDKLYDIQMQDLTDQANTAYEKLLDDSGQLKIDVDTADFDNVMDNILNANYAIDVAIHTEAEQEFDSINNALNDIREKASLIGDDFVIAGDKIRELGNTFPGILDGMTYLADGTIQLNGEMVQSAMAAAETEAKADAQATISKLKGQAEVLRAKQQSYQNMANAARVLASTEVDNAGASANAQAEISQELGNLKTLNEQTASQSQMNNAAEVADNSQKNASVLSSNWQSAFQNMADSSVQAASIAIDNMDAVASNDRGKLNSGRVQVEYQGNSGVDEEASILEMTGDLLNNPGSDNSELWAELASKYAGLANSAGAAANDIESMIAQIGATATGVDNIFGNIAKGHGSDGSSKGGGGKDATPKDPDYIEFLEDEADRYHDINIEIDDLTTQLDRLQKIEDRLTGQDLIDNLNKQLNIIQKQKDAYSTKLALVRAEMAEVKSALSDQGVKFNSDGYIDNYGAALQSKLDYVNGLISTYNAMSAAEQESFKNTIEQAKKEYEEFKNKLERYDALITNELPGLQDQIEDNLSREIEIQIQKFDMKVQLRLDMAEAEREWNHFKRKIIDDLDDDDLTGKITQSYKDILSYYNTNGTGTGSIQAQTSRVNSILAELATMKNGGHSSIYSAYDAGTGTWVDDEARATEDLKKAYSSLMDDLESVKDLENEVRDAFLESIDAVNEAFNQQKENYEFIGAQIDHDIKMLELLYGDQAYDKMESYYETQLQNTQATLAAQQESLKYWKEKMEVERAAVEAGTGDKEALAKYEANWKESVSNVNQLLEDWATNLTKKYENTIDKMIQSLNDKVSNGLGLDYLDEELSLLNSNSENYLDNINAAYAVQKLSNKWQDAINNTDNVSTQKELNTLMQEQLAMLEQKGKLTQYDIDRAEKEYDIALKQMALKEVQQNQSKMRLKRDANGNYTYQFVSDEDSIREAEQELAAAQNELYNFDKSAYQNNLNEMYSTWNEFQQKIAEAYKTYANDQDALNEHIALLQQQYGEKINFLTEQNLSIRNNLTNSAFEELANMYNTDVSHFQNMTEAEKELLLNDLIPQWDSGVQQMIDKFSGEGGFEEMCKNTFDKLKEAADEYQSSLDEIKDKNQAMSDEALNQGDKLLEQSDQLLQAAQDEYNRVGEVISQVNKLRDAYEEAKRAAIEASKAAYAYTQNGSLSDDSGSSSGGSTGPANGADSSAGGGASDGSSSSGASTVGDGQLQTGDTATFTGRYYHTSTGRGPTGSRYAGVTNGVIVDILNNHAYGAHLRSADGKYPDLGWVKRSQLTGFDTGGYTGSWGDTGRLALLHQKELVLNATDTSNVLSAVNILRGIVDMVGENAFNKASSMLSSLPVLANTTTQAQTLEQTVYITAQFEGQTEADQIQTALDNLVNIAAQRANRNKK